MSRYANIVANQNVNSPIIGREKDMVKNPEGAYIFKTDMWTNALRWLILGSASGTYYVGANTLTLANVSYLNNCIKENGKRLVDMIVDVSTNGRGASNETCVFALAYTCSIGDKEVRKYALDQISKVCRIGTDLYRFIDSLMILNGKKWNRSLRKAIASWYDDKRSDEVAYQITKYAARIVREGESNSRWSHADLIKLSHPRNHTDIYGYTIGKINAVDTNSDLIKAIHELHNNKTLSQKSVVGLIENFNLPHEVIPNEYKNEVWLWESLALRMPLNALIRNLPKITSVEASRDTLNEVARRIKNAEYVRKSRIHPIQILKAIRAYSIGYNRNMTWTPSRVIIDALDSAYYSSYENVSASGKRILLALDTSGSMDQTVLGMDYMSAREASCALALPTLAVEENAHVVYFTTKVSETTMSARQRLDDAVRLSRRNTGGTDIACPIQYALNKKMMFDTFVIYTDNATNQYKRHPQHVLEEYRRKMNKNAQMVVVALTGQMGSVADPNDLGTLDLVGCDTATPRLITSFINGEFSRN